MNHRLKCWPESFDSIERGEKSFEVRYDHDRGFAVGDHLTLGRFSPHAGGAWVTMDGTPCSFDASAKLEVVVTYKLHGGQFGIDPRWCVLGIRKA